MLFLGNVALGKGIQYLVEAARLLAAEPIQFLVGGTPYIASAAIKSAPRNIRWLGRIPRSSTSELYSGCDLFVFPTLSDGFGLTQLEALAHGLPVITTQNCGRVVEDQVTGFLVQPRDPQALADAILRFVRDEKLIGRMAPNCQTAVKAFSVDAYSRGLFTIIEKHMCCRRAERTPRAGQTQRFEVGKGAAIYPAVHELPLQQGSGAAKGQESMWMFRFLGRSVMALPAEPKALHPRALARYQAHTLRRQCYRYIVGAALRTGSARLIVRQVRRSALAPLGLDYARWIALFREKLGRHELHAAFMWPSQPHRRRFYCHLFDAKLDCLAFVKIGFLSHDAKEMEGEFSTLSALAHLAPGRLRLPRPLAYGHFDDAVFLILEPLPQGAHVPGWHRKTNVLPLMCRVHGDLGLSNLVEANDAVWLFDWEFTDSAGPVLADEVGYFLSFSVGRASRNPHLHLRELASQFLEGADERRLLDVMLALAYRHASGIRDAQVYMKHWSLLAHSKSLFE
ncbi:MAG: glycosyltransferase [Verrucomicrobia bacterium]|nr:glycosyltransferase [Verrucomicrobiota bacterium]